MSHTVRLARSTIIVYAQQIVLTLIGAIYFICLTRLLPPYEMGVYSALCFLWVILNFAPTLALHLALVRFIPHYLGRGEKDKAGAVAFTGFIVVSVMAFTIFALVQILTPNISRLLLGKESYTGLIRILSVSMLFSTLSSLLDAIMQALELWSYRALITIASWSFGYVSIILMLYRGLGLLSVAIGWLIQAATAVAMFFLVAFRKFRPVKLWHPMRPLLSYSIPLYVSNIIAIVANWADRLVVLKVLKLEELGYYHVATTAFMILWGIPLIISYIVFPFLSKLYAVKNAEIVELGISKIIRYLFLAYTPAVVFSSLTAPVVVVTLLGIRYERSIYPFQIMAFFSLLAAIYPEIIIALLTLKKSLLVMLINIMVIVIDLALSLNLIAILSIEGAAMARVLSLVTGAIASTLLLRRMVRIEVDVSEIGKIVFSAFITSPILTLSLLIEIMELYWRLPLLIGLGLLYLLSYALILRILKVLKKEDVQLLEGIMIGPLKGLVRKLSPILVSS